MASSSYISEVEFLPAGSVLVAPVTLSDEGIPVHIRSRVETWTRQLGFMSSKLAVPITLEEPLKICFSISRSLRVKKELMSCRCSIPFEKEKPLESVNSAYQRVSEIVEPHRMSRGGNVYKCIFYRDIDRRWRPLSERRDEVYEPHCTKYKDIVQKLENSTPPLIGSQEPFSRLVVADRERLAQILRANKEDVIHLLQELDEFYQSTNLRLYHQKIEEFEANLHPSRAGTLSEAFWQDWIYKNSWMLGSHYRAPLPKERVGFGGSSGNVVAPKLTEGTRFRAGGRRSGRGSRS